MTRQFTCAASLEMTIWKECQAAMLLHCWLVADRGTLLRFAIFDDLVKYVLSI